MKSLLQMVLAVVCAALAVTGGPATQRKSARSKTPRGRFFCCATTTSSRPSPAIFSSKPMSSSPVPTAPSAVTLIDNSRLSAGPNTRVEFKQFRFNPTTQEGESLTQLHRGTLAIVSGQIAKRSPDAMKVQTPTTILGVRGTKFAVKVEE